MVALSMRSTIVATLGSLVVAQFPPTPHGLTTKNVEAYPGVSIAYKRTTICETTAKAWAGYIHMPSSYLKDGEASEEVVHDVFLNIWNRREELEISSFPNFLLTAVRYQVYNRLRSAKSPVIYEADHSAFTAITDTNRAENKIEEEELYRVMYDYLEELPKRCREIFCMSRIEQLSNEEIAARLGISKRTVENQITAALKHLRECYRYIAVIAVLFKL